MARSRRSFAWRLTAAFVGIGLISAGLSALLINAIFQERFNQYLDARTLEVRSSLLTSIPHAYLGDGQWDRGRLAQIGASTTMQGGTLDILGTDGAEVWNSASVRGAMDAAMNREMMGGGPLGPPYSQDIVVDGQVVGTAVITLPAAGLLSHDTEFRASVNRSLLLGALTAGLVALVLGYVLSARAVRPARSVADAATRFAGGDHATRAEYERDDEFGDMAMAFNAMADIVEDEDRMRRGFASDIAHELRTPLAILVAQTESMLDGAVPIDEPAITSMHEEVLRLSRLVRDLETMGSATAARFSLRREQVDLRAVVEQTASRLDHGFQEAGVALELNLDDAAVWGDSDRLHQVMTNLLTNALRFTPAGGSVRVSLREGDGEVTIEVHDTGSGIPADEQARVFERFFRGRNARAGGSGIGLAVVHELVAAHGGALSVTSEDGRGSTFRVELPEGEELAPTVTWTPPSGSP